MLKYTGFFLTLKLSYTVFILRINVNMPIIVGIFTFMSRIEFMHGLVKDKDYCPIEIIKGLTDKGQFQYLTKLMGPQEGTYLYATQFHSLR